MWYNVATIILVWALMGNWEVVDRSLDSIEKALHVVSSLLPDKAAPTAAGTMQWIFLTALRLIWIVPSLMLCKCTNCRDGRKK